MKRPDPKSLGRDRQDIDSNAAARNDTPHLTPQDDDGEIPDDIPGDGDVAALPSNASGIDKVTVDDQNQEIDDESMYDRRPAEDKDQPPSERK